MPVDPAVEALVDRKIAFLERRIRDRGLYYKHAELHLAQGRDPLPAGGTSALNTESFVVLGLSGNLTAERLLTAGDGVAIADAGANGNVTVSIKDYEVTITVESPSASEDIAVRIFDYAVTVQEVHGVIVGGTSVNINPVHGTDRSAAGTALFASAQTVNSLTAGNSFTSFADATIDAGGILRLKTTAVVGSVTELSVTFRYRKT